MGLNAIYSSDIRNEQISPYDNTWNNFTILFFIEDFLLIYIMQFDIFFLHVSVYVADERLIKKMSNQ